MRCFLGWLAALSTVVSTSGSSQVSSSPLQFINEVESMSQQERWLLQSTAAERAQCQCSTDGFSGGTNVFYWAKFGSTYKSQDIERGGPYKFIGCGAHKYYRDKEERQIAGYPWRLCFTVGGKQGCQMTKTSQKHSLNNQIAYRFCNGDYDCDVKAHHRIAFGTVLDSLILDEFDQDGYLQDWTNCCRQCRLHEGNCTVWDFSVETNTCRIFGTDSYTAEERMPAGEIWPPMWYYGTPGFDDAPVECSRNEYDTCKDNLTIQWAVALSSGTIGFTLVLCFACAICLKSAGATFVATDDVTPGPTRSETRTRSTKHGTETYTVSIHSACVVYRMDGNVRRDTLERGSTPFQANEKLHLKVEDGTAELASSCVPRVWGCILMLPLALFFPFILALANGITTKDGDEFIAHYTLFGEPDGWGVIYILSFVLLGVLAMAVICFDYYYIAPRAKPENTLIKSTDSLSNGDKAALSHWGSNEPKWQVLTDGGWQFYPTDQASLLERAYQDLHKAAKVEVRIGGNWLYEIDVVNQTQTNVEHPSRTQRPIRRRNVTTDKACLVEGRIHVPLETAVVWECCVDSGWWEEYSPSVAMSLENAAQTVCAMAPVELYTSSFKYEVNVGTMVQTNVQHPARTQRQVRRIAAMDSAMPEQPRN